MQFKFRRVPVGGFFTDLPSQATFGLAMEDMESFVDSGYLDRITNAVLFLNLFLLAAYSLRDLGMPLINFDQNMWSTIELCFSVLFVFELGVRLAVDSPQEYFSVLGQKFDCIAILAPFVAGILFLLPQKYFGRDELVYLSVLRTLRLLRLLASTETFSFIAGCTWRVVSGSHAPFALLLAVMYVFASIGGNLFGGLIFDGNETLDGTDFRALNYDILNFNSLSLAMNTLALSVVLGVIPQVFEATTIVSSFWVSFFFWGAFYVCGVLVAFNVLTSFIISLFLRMYEVGEEGARIDMESTHVLFRRNSTGIVVIDTTGIDDVYKKLFMDDELEYSKIMRIYANDAKIIIPSTIARKKSVVRNMHGGLKPEIP